MKKIKGIRIIVKQIIKLYFRCVEYRKNDMIVVFTIKPEKVLINHYCAGKTYEVCGEAGIRTLGTLSRSTA